MLEIKVKTLNDPAFNQALGTLANCKDLKDFKTTWDISKLVRRVRTEVKELGATYQKILEDWIEVDDKGQRVPATPPSKFPFKVKSGKDEAEFFKKLDEFMETTVEFDVQPLKAEWLDGVKISPNDVLALEEILTFPPEKNLKPV